MKKAKAYFKLFRGLNLVIMALVLLVLRYGFLLQLGFETYLSTVDFAILVLITLTIAAGGNAVNDAFDEKADAVNRPDSRVVGVIIGKENALFLGQFLLLIGAIGGLAFGFFTQTLTFSYIFPLCALLLWLYSNYLKRQTFIGNLVVAFLAALLVLLEIVFDLLKTLSVSNADFQQQGIVVIAIVAAFSFVLTLIREIVKDLEDVAGDRVAGYKTLPITSGTLFPRILVVLLTMLVMVSCGWLAWQNISANDYISGIYILITIILPLFYVMVRIAPASSSSRLGAIGNVLKGVMVFGILALVIFTFSFKRQLQNLQQETPPEITIERAE